MKYDFKSRLSLALLWIFVFLIIFFILPFTVHAEDEPTYPLIIDFAQNPANVTLEEIQNAYSIMWGDLPDSYILYCSSHDQGYYNGSHGWDYYDTYTYVIGVNPVFDYPDTLSVSSPYYYITNDFEYYFVYIPDFNHWGDYNSAANIRHQYAYYYMSQGLGWLLYGSENEYTSLSDVVVWAHEYSTPIDIGVAIIPPDAFIPEYPNGFTPPSLVPPTYTTTDYNWTTPPTFDGSSVENALGSIQNLLGWLANNLKEEFKNLTNNLKGLFKYIGDTIQYYGNAIISTLNNFIQNFYDNMANLVQPIYDKFSYITEPLDLVEVENALSSSSIYSLVSVGSSFMNTFKNYFDNIFTPDTLSFHIPYTILTQSGYIDFDFGWYSDIRDSVLPWIVGFLYAGFGLAFFRSIPSIIHGVSGILQKGG